MKLILDLDKSRCSACGACAVACMDQNDIDIQRTSAPFRVVQDIENPVKDTFAYISISCFHCEDAPCVEACPVGCLYKDEETGFTLFNTENCIGCHSCSMACPFAAPTFAEDGKMQKCDGCYTRIKHGMKPACVQNCPTDAISVLTEEEYNKVQKNRSLTALSKKILGGL